MYEENGMKPDYEPEGSKMLLVVSIIMIFSAIISFIVSIANFNIANTYDSGGSAAIKTGAFITALACGLELVCAAMGIAGWKKPKIAGACKLMGIILVALILVGNFITIIGTGNYSSILFIASGCVLPVLYVVGANKLERS